MNDGLIALGAGTLYTAGTDVPMDQLENDAYFAGALADGCTLSVTGDVHPVTDEHGSLICEIAGAQKISMKGNLLQMSEKALSLALSCDVFFGEVLIGRLSKTGERIPKVNLLLVCAYRQKTLRVFLSGCPADGIRLDFSGRNPAKIPFTVSAVSEKNEGAPAVQVKIS